MAWSNGSSTDFQDQLDILITAAVGNGWTTDRNTTMSDVQEWIAHNADGAYIGVRTFHDAPSGAYSWELAGFTGYASGNSWETQPGISPGRYDAGTAALQYGAYVPLLNSSMDYWIAAHARRLTGFIRAGTGYFSFYLGMLDAYATAGEYPMPLYVAGSTPLFDAIPSDSVPSLSSISDPIGFAVGNNGPAFLRFTDGQWYTVRNSYGSVSRTNSNDVVVFPAGSPLINATRTPDDADRWMSLTYTWQNFIPNSGLPGTPSAGLYPTPGSVDKNPLVPATVLMQSPSEQFVGELRGVYWVSGSGGATSEDTLTEGGDTFMVFQNGNKTDVWARTALKEA